MKKYRVLTNFVSRIYNIGDTFTEEDFSNVRMLEYHLQRGNVAEVVEEVDVPKQNKNRKSNVKVLEEDVELE